MPDGAKTVALQYPIEANGETLTSLTLRRPKMGDMKAMDGVTGDVARQAALIGALAGIPPSSVDELDGEDFMTISSAVADFFGGALPTGGS